MKLSQGGGDKRSVRKIAFAPEKNPCDTNTAGI
jgi:hypothetical protein